MKTIKTASLVFLVVLFIGIAGGFTKTEYGWWVDGIEECSIPNINPFMPSSPDYFVDPFTPQDILKKECNAVGGVWKKGERYFSKADKIDQSYAPHQTNFDPKSTALFVIAGAIIALVGLEMRKKK